MKNPLRRQPDGEPEPVAGFFPETAALRAVPPPGPDDAYLQPGGGFGSRAYDAVEAARVRQLEGAARNRAEMRRGDGYGFDGQRFTGPDGQSLALADVVHLLGDIKRKVDDGDE